MSDLKCYIVGDLLPLYLENACSEQTARDVEAHLQICPHCQKLYREMSADLSGALPMPVLEGNQLFRHAQRTILAILGALAVVILCLLVNIGGAWMGGPAGPLNLAVTVFYLLFWGLFTWLSRKYAPLMRFVFVVSTLTFISSANSLMSILLGRGGFITALFSILASVPLYGLRAFLEWEGLYTAATLLSSCWMLYTFAAQRKLNPPPPVSDSFKKRRRILTAALPLSLLPMLLPQYGGARGVQEISGLLNLRNPLALASVLLFIAGVWGAFQQPALNRVLPLAGAAGIVCAEIFNFLTWHIPTITGKFDLMTSFRMVFPEFYIGLACSLALLILTIRLTRPGR